MQVSDHNLLILAHRGARTQAPENTLAAFRLAIEQGADGIEMDVRLTADGEVVVFHDEKLGRITGAEGRVNRHTLSELKRLDAGCHFSREYAGERIPTLREVFSSLDGSATFDIELTDYLDPFGPLTRRVIQLVREYKLRERVFLTSFNPYPLLAARRLFPELDCGLIAFKGGKGSLQRSLAGRLISRRMIVPFHSDLTEKYMRSQKRKNRKVVTWTVNTGERIRSLVEWRIDGIITDKPDLAVNELRTI